MYDKTFVYVFVYFQNLVKSTTELKWNKSD